MISRRSCWRACCYSNNDEEEEEQIVKAGVKIDYSQDTNNFCFKIKRTTTQV